MSTTCGYILSSNIIHARIIFLTSQYIQPLVIIRSWCMCIMCVCVLIYKHGCVEGHYTDWPIG